MTVKEVAQVAGTLAQAVPLPSPIPISRQAGHSAASAGVSASTTGLYTSGLSALTSADTNSKHSTSSTHAQQPMLSEEQFAGLGWMLVEQLLLVIKHQGAVDKAHLGLCTLATKSLR